MEFDECLKKRKSVRKYSKKVVSFDKIAEILEAARLAPSSGNLQNWSFVVVENNEKKANLCEACLKQYWMQEASYFIIICSRIENIKKFYNTRGEILYAIQNCAAAIENMLLKATDLGLGSCWIGAFDEEAVSRILKIPNGVRPQAIITIGYSEDPEESPRRYNLEDLTHFNEWGGKKDYSLFPIQKHQEKIKEKGKGFLGLFKKNK